MMRHKIVLMLALLCAIAQGTWAQTSWEEVYQKTGTTSDKWTAINAGSTTGQTLGSAGSTTYCYAGGDLRFTNSNAGGSGLTIQGTVYLYVPQGVTLTCIGANANGQTGAGAGIELAAGNTLYLFGGGTVNAMGGNGAALKIHFATELMAANHTLVQLDSLANTVLLGYRGVAAGALFLFIEC